MDPLSTSQSDLPAPLPQKPSFNCPKYPNIDQALKMRYVGFAKQVMNANPEHDIFSVSRSEMDRAWLWVVRKLVEEMKVEKWMVKNTREIKMKKAKAMMTRPETERLWANVAMRAAKRTKASSVGEQGQGTTGTENHDLPPKAEDLSQEMEAVEMRDTATEGVATGVAAINIRS